MKLGNVGIRMEEKMRAKVMVVGTALLFLAGCGGAAASGGTAVEHPLTVDLSEQVNAGQCAPVEGPYAVPDGATMEYTVTDSDGTDDMDVAVIPDAAGCTFSAGYGGNPDVASVNDVTGEVPADTYDFVVRCNNLVLPCVFTLSWSATY